jgi:uridine kinase
MDDFFVDRVLSPRAPDGSYDFESVENLNLALMDDSIHRLIAGEEVQLPRYDFIDGKSKPGKIMRIQSDQIIILEGIHGMNPKLLQGIDADNKFKIYASPLTQVNVDRYNRVSTVDTRLLRRVRDYRDRGYSAQDTIGRWGSVRRGEEKFIIPYQTLADEYCNTSLVYELSALKPLAETALRQVQWGSGEYIEAKRLLSFLDWVLPLPDGLVPPNSILAEFTGGSNLKDFTVWKNN